jgi:co-chaperonin GroES (HSP10)
MQIDEVEKLPDELSFIEKHEEKEAQELIKKHLGFEPPRMTGYHMAVKIYVRPEELSEITTGKGEKKKLYLPEKVRAEDKWRNCTALVVSQGPDCYKTGRFLDNPTPWCRVGDWVVIPRNEGTQVNYRGVPMQFIPDDRVLAIIEDPTYVTRD